MTVAELSREEARRLLVELADLLGYYPASLAPDDVARYRKEAAERRVERSTGVVDVLGPGATSAANGAI